MKRMWQVLMLCALLVMTTGMVFAASEPVSWVHNTAGVEREPCLAGNVLYYVKDYDIYQSTWDGNNWSVPVAVPGLINTMQNEINPHVVKNGTVMYFARYDPVTNYDFYRSEWDPVKKEWGEAVLIAEWSTPDQEWDVWVNEDETVAYITNKIGYGGVAPIGGRDIWKSVKQDGKWSTPVNLGAPINTNGDEWHVFVDKQGRIYFESSRTGTLGNFDIWVAETEQGPVSNLTIMNSSAGERGFTMNDEFMIVAGDRRPGGPGSYDLFILPLK